MVRMWGGAALGRKFVVAMLCVSMVSACATTYSGALTPEQAQMKAQKDTWNKTVLTGALVGAATGAAIGAAAGRGSNDSGAAVLVGLVGGLIVGTIAGAVVADRNLKFENRELGATERLQAAKESTQNLETRAMTAEVMATKSRQRLDELDAQFRANHITAVRYRAEAEQERKNVEMIRDSAADAKKARDKIVLSSQQVPGLMEEEPKMGDAQRRLEQSADQIEEKLNRIPTT